jgi:hypothetical protein
MCESNGLIDIQGCFVPLFEFWTSVCVVTICWCNDTTVIFFGCNMNSWIFRCEITLFHYTTSVFQSFSKNWLTVPSNLQINHLQFPFLYTANIPNSKCICPNFESFLIHVCKIPLFLVWLHSILFLVFLFSFLVFCNVWTRTCSC